MRHQPAGELDQHEQPCQGQRQSQRGAAAVRMIVVVMSMAVTMAMYTMV